MYLSIFKKGAKTICDRGMILNSFFLHSNFAVPVMLLDDVRVQRLALRGCSSGSEDVREDVRATL